jgi:hypothetical protein
MESSVEVGRASQWLSAWPRPKAESDMTLTCNPELHNRTRCTSHLPPRTSLTLTHTHTHIHTPQARCHDNRRHLDRPIHAHRPPHTTRRPLRPRPRRNVVPGLAPPLVPAQALPVRGHLLAVHVDVDGEVHLQCVHPLQPPPRLPC